MSTAEVEAALMVHAAVAEAAVVSRPHKVKGECLYCFITLKNNKEFSQTLADELKNLGKTWMWGWIGRKRWKAWFKCVCRLISVVFGSCYYILWLKVTLTVITDRWGSLVSSVFINRGRKHIFNISADTSLKLLLLNLSNLRSFFFLLHVR